jgi:hypothetical protein
MFYPITSRAVRRRKDELGAFGRIDAGGHHGQNDCISPRDKGISGDWSPVLIRSEPGSDSCFDAFS